MPFCPASGQEAPEMALFCSHCGEGLHSSHSAALKSGTENVMGIVLFGGYYKDICFTDSRVIQFEPMKDRWKFLAQPLGLKPLIVEKGGNLNDVLLFKRSEFLLSEVSAIEVKNHSRVLRGHIN